MTEEQYYQMIVDEKAARTELDGLTSTANSAEWIRWARLTAWFARLLEARFFDFKKEVDKTISYARISTAPWWEKTMREFQWSTSTLYYVQPSATGQPTYNVVNEADQLIKYVAIQEQLPGLGGNNLLVKVAKQVGGLPAPLDDTTVNVADQTELTACEAYIDALRPAGRKVRLLSLPADTLQVWAKIYINRTANATLIKPKVEAAILAYLSGLPFDGTFYRETLRDRLQAVEGVEDVEFAHTNPSLPPIVCSPGTTVIGQQHRFSAGYAKIDPTTGLSTTIRYVPNV